MNVVEHVTLVNPSCKHNCNHCGYPEYSAVQNGEIEKITCSLQSQGFAVKLYDMDVTRASIELMRLTSQYKSPKGFGWLNITENFDPTHEQLRELESMRFGFCISLQGVSPKQSSILSGKPQRFERLIRKFKEIAHLFPEKPKGIAMVVHSENIDSINQIVNMGQNLEVDFVEFINLLYAGRARTRLQPETFLDKQNISTALKTIQRAARRAPFEIQLDSTWGPTDHIIPSVTVIPEASHRNCSMFAPALEDRFCNAGHNHIALRTDTGKVFPCPGMSTIDELAIGYFDGRNIVVTHEKVSQIGEPCTDCTLYKGCQGGCRIAAITEGERLTGALNRYIGQYNCAKYIMENV